MIGRMLMLIRRELWEHRALTLTPLVIGGLIVLAVTISLISAALFNGLGFDNLVFGLDVAGEKGSSAGFSALTLAPLLIFTATLFFTVFFYSLDALYAERKDKSVLFWRSLPLTDTEAVLSKMLVAVLIAPMIAFAAAFVTQILVLIVSTIVVWIGGGDASELIWGPLPLLDITALSFFRVIEFGLWTLPFAAWFLLCSAFVKKTPFLWAVLPFFLIPLLERLAFRTDLFVEIVWGQIRDVFANVFDLTPARLIAQQLEIDEADMPGLITLIEPMDLLSTPQIWVGALVAAGLLAATVYVRRYRVETES